MGSHGILHHASTTWLHSTKFHPLETSILAFHLQVDSSAQSTMICRPGEAQLEANPQGVWRVEAPAGRAFRVAPCTVSLPSHFDDLY